MSILTVSNTSSASAAQTASAVSNTVQTDEEAMQAFVQALGQVVSFRSAGALPSLPGILAKADAAQQNAAPTPMQSQSNDQPQQQNDAGPKIVQSGQNGPSKYQGVRVSSSGTAKDTNGPSADTVSSARDTQNNKDANAVDPTTDQTVMAVVAQQVVQVTQTTAPVQTVTGDVAQGVQEQAQTAAQDTAQTGPVGPINPDEQHGPKTGGPVQNTTGQDTHANTQSQTANQDDTWSLIQGSGNATSKAQGTKTAKGDDLKSTKDLQAEDLARSLDGTGANLAIKVNVDAHSKSKANDATVAEAAAPLQVITAADLLGSGSNGQNLTKDDGNQQTATPVATPTTEAAPSAADSLAQTAQVFNAVLAAQLEGNQADAAPAPTPQAINGVTSVSGTQAAQKTDAAKAPQAPTPPRAAQQAQVMDQVSVQIAKQVKEGVDKITVKLNPQELGRVEIKLEVAKDGTVQATVTAENKETLAMLQKDASGLVKALSDAGLNTDAGSMNFNLQGGNQQQFAGDANGQNGGNNSRARWAAMNSGADDVVAAQAVQSSSGSLSAVDLSV